jgi:hypothetical protein
MKKRYVAEIHTTSIAPLSVEACSLKEAKRIFQEDLRPPSYPYEVGILVSFDELKNVRLWKPNTKPVTDD